MSGNSKAWVGFKDMGCSSADGVGYKKVMKRCGEKKEGMPQNVLDDRRMIPSAINTFYRRSSP